MNKEVVKVIPNCIEKLGKFTPAKHREIRKSLICFLPFSVLGGTIYCIYKERTLQHDERILQMEMEHEERILQIELEHEEKMEEIKTNLLSRAEEGKHEKDN